MDTFKDLKLPLYIFLIFLTPEVLVHIKSTQRHDCYNYSDLTVTIISSKMPRKCFPLRLSCGFECRLLKCIFFSDQIVYLWFGWSERINKSSLFKLWTCVPKLGCDGKKNILAATCNWSHQGVVVNVEWSWETFKIFLSCKLQTNYILEKGRAFVVQIKSAAYGGNAAPP